MIKWSKTILYTVGSAILANFLPFSAFFKNIDTLIHEFGHAVVTLALSGSVMNIALYADQSGVTRSAVTNGWSMLPIGLAGYMTASLFTWYLFASYAKGRQRSGLIMITLIATVTLVLFVRNGYGFTWLLGFIALNVIVLIFAGKGISRFYYLLIAFLSLEESVLGSIWLNLAAVLRPGRAGDATLLSQTTSVPALVWSLWFTLFAVWCAKQAISAFAGRDKVL
ncbi:MAG: M50 family metallopeptidase [Paenibacillaceae bacterium]